MKTVLIISLIANAILLYTTCNQTAKYVDYMTSLTQEVEGKNQWNK